MPKQANGRQPLSTFRFAPDVLQQIDLLGAYLADKLGLARMSRADVLRYTVSRTFRAEIPAGFPADSAPSGVQLGASPSSKRTSPKRKKSA